MASFCLVEVGNIVIKSMEMVSHFHSGVGKGCNSLVGCLIRGSNFAQFSKCSECDENSSIASVSSS
jgi:hypothetical protein